MLRSCLWHCARKSCSQLQFTRNELPRNVGCLQKIGQTHPVRNLYIHSKIGAMSALKSSPKAFGKTLQFSTQSSTGGNSEDNSNDENSDMEQNTTDEEKGEALNIDEELLRYNYEEFELKDDYTEQPQRLKPKKTLPFASTRGKTGVFDLEELCILLRKDNATDICVIHVPPALNYVDFLVIATGRSERHLRALAEYIKWAYKQKRSKTDTASVKIEGELTHNWFALDLGNIALHLMLKKIRTIYDLEQLWAVGPEFDEQVRAEMVASVQSAVSLEDFSFDAELEKFRQLREENDSGNHPQQLPPSRQNSQQENRKKTRTGKTLDSVAGWHG